MQKQSTTYSVEQFHNVIETLKTRSSNNTFTSHEFIGEYMKQYEFDYIGKLMERRTPAGNHAFRTVNADIGRFLADKQGELHISNCGKVKDTNVHHLETDNEEWCYIDTSQQDIDI